MNKSIWVNIWYRENAYRKFKLPLSVAAVRIPHRQRAGCRCCLSVTAVTLSDRYGIVNQWPLEEADPGCLLAHHWVLLFICSIPGCLSFPGGNTQHAQALRLTEEKKNSRWEQRSRPHACGRLMFQSARTATLSPLPMQKTRLYLLRICVCADICAKYVFVCLCWCGLFEDVHSKTGRRVVGSIKVLTPLH